MRSATRRSTLATKWLVRLCVVAAVAGCAYAIDLSARPTRSDPAAEGRPNDDVADRVRSLGEHGAAHSPTSQDVRLSAGLAPDPEAPLFIGDYADPFVLAVGDDLYLYTTNTVDYNVPVLSAESGEAAVGLGDALPDLPEWTTAGAVWAPSVLATEQGYVLYYTSLHRESGLQCVGAAFSTSPRGPFVDAMEQPFVCQLDLGGTIDASPFRSSGGDVWLLYKNDGNCCDLPTSIWTQRLDDSGLSFVGEPVDLLTTSEMWEGPLVEGPAMVEAEGRYWLFYSANDWNSSEYATGAASCATPTGPCSKNQAPWLSSHGWASGPGGLESFIDARHRSWVIYHAWVAGLVGYENGGVRALFAARLELDAGTPSVRGWRS